MPTFKIVTHGIVCMQLVDVQQIDAAVAKPTQRLVVGQAQQCREILVMLVVEPSVFVVNFISILAAPGIHRMAAGRQSVLKYCLAERRVGDTAAGSKLNKQAW